MKLRLLLKGGCNVKVRKGVKTIIGVTSRERKYEILCTSKYSQQNKMRF